MLLRVGQEYLTPLLAEDEFTCQQFADLHGTSYGIARKALDRAIAAGAVIEVGRRRVNGKTPRAYKLV